MMEILGNKKTQKIVDKYSCLICDFYSCHKNDYLKHLETKKHSLSVVGNFGNKKTQKKPISENGALECSGCFKKYKTNSGLWKHSKQCASLNSCSEVNANKMEVASCNSVDQNKPNLDCETLTNLFLDSMKKNQEFQKQMFDMMKETMTTIQDQPQQLITNNKITTNNQFNLNFFLNETCKDAMNIYDFMESIQIQLDDLDYTGASGYVAGVSRIFIRELKKLDVCKRPIHCTDIKREVFHVKNKDNQWEKERKLLITTIKEITRRNVVHLNEWREAYPGCMEYYNKKNDQYLRIQSEILGAADSEEDMKYYNKIISTVAKATVIDKNTMLQQTDIKLI